MKIRHEFVERVAMDMPEKDAMLRRFERRAVSAVVYKPSERRVGQNILIESLPFDYPLDIFSRKKIEIEPGERVDLPNDALVLDIFENPEKTKLTIEYMLLTEKVNVASPNIDGHWYDRLTRKMVTLSRAVWTPAEARVNTPKKPGADMEPILVWAVPDSYEYKVMAFSERPTADDFYIIGKICNAKGQGIDGAKITIERMTPDNIRTVLFDGLSTEINDSAEYRLMGVPLICQNAARLHPGDKLVVFMEIKTKGQIPSWKTSKLSIHLMRIKSCSDQE